LLCELVAEMGITREQFKAACESSANNPTHHRIVQQILGVDDFESFKKMMIKKNMQINEICM
jgi:protein-disulfide isomerase-like protein with CxxC motif